MTAKPILLFADKLWPDVGGVESHADNFIQHFQSSPDYPLLGVVSITDNGRKMIKSDKGTRTFDVRDAEIQQAAILFHNGGRWIECFDALRIQFSKAFHVYRTGGNEIVKARLSPPCPESHAERQAIWAARLNANIDLLITNSAFTEARLAALGVTCPFLRVIGGVPKVSESIRSTRGETIRMFCAARFVPYKNHAQLIQVIRAVISSGVKIELRLAGDGPLLEDIRAMAKAGPHADSFTFLGKITNGKVMEEIAAADYYVQFSLDLITHVNGGSYVHAEGMGRSVLEAISCGVHVIALRTGALSEIVTESRGTLLPPDSTNHSLVARICELLSRRPPEGAPTNAYSWDAVFSSYKKHWRHVL